MVHKAGEHIRHELTKRDTKVGERVTWLENLQNLLKVLKNLFKNQMQTNLKMKYRKLIKNKQTNKQLSITGDKLCDPSWVTNLHYVT